MISFWVCFAILVIGYFVYGGIVANTLGPDDRETPAVYRADGVDYVVLPQWKLFLIQLLNIAGLGPIFGAVAGAQWGPIVFLWITFGTVFAGGVHDYFSGMMSERHDGASIAEVCGMYLGPVMKWVMRAFAIVLLILVGTVFAKGPAGILKNLAVDYLGEASMFNNVQMLLGIVFFYYFVATFVPVDKVIGRLYPIFGFVLIFMAVGVIGGVIVKGYEIPEIWTNFSNFHPAGTPIWSVMFITVACGAISGFHSTQSPIMARCMASEKQGHFVFYGAMVAEGLIALVWAAAACAFFPRSEAGLFTGLAENLKSLGGPAGVVYHICQNTMGPVGTLLAMLGVVVCPITSGDTAFRAARLTISDIWKIDQANKANRLALSVVVLGIGTLLGFKINFGALWLHFTWTNQTLAMIVLWTAAMFLFRNKKNYWIAAVPATFMSAVSATYFIMNKNYLNMSTDIAYPGGIVVAILFLGMFIHATKKEA